MKKISLLIFVWIALAMPIIAQKVITLKSGKKLTVIDNSAEDNIIAFLQNPQSSLDTSGVSNWYDLEQTKFDLGKTTLQKTALLQLKILRLF